MATNRQTSDFLGTVLDVGGAVLGTINRHQAAKQLTTAQSQASIFADDFFQTLKGSKNVEEYPNMLSKFQDDTYATLRESITNASALREFDNFWEASKATSHSRMTRLQEANSRTYGVEAMVTNLDHHISRGPESASSLLGHYERTMNNIDSTIETNVVSGLLNPDEAERYRRDYKTRFMSNYSEDLSRQALTIMLEGGVAPELATSFIEKAIQLDGADYDDWLAEQEIHNPVLMEIALAYRKMDISDDAEKTLVNNLRTHMSKERARIAEADQAKVAAHVEQIGSVFRSQDWRSLADGDYKLIEDTPLSTEQKVWWRERVDIRLETERRVQADADKKALEVSQNVSVEDHEIAILNILNDPEATLEDVSDARQAMFDDPLMLAQGPVRRVLNGQLDTAADAIKARELADTAAKEEAAADEAAQAAVEAHRELLTRYRVRVDALREPSTRARMIKDLRTAVRNDPSLSLEESEHLANEITAIEKESRELWRDRKEAERTRMAAKAEQRETAEWNQRRLGVDIRVLAFETAARPDLQSIRSLMAELHTSPDFFDRADYREARIDELEVIYDVAVEQLKVDPEWTDPRVESGFWRLYLSDAKGEELNKYLEVNGWGEGLNNATTRDMYESLSDPADREALRQNHAFVNISAVTQKTFEAAMRRAEIDPQDFVEMSTQYSVATQAFINKVNSEVDGKAFRSLEPSHQTALLLDLQEALLAPLMSEAILGDTDSSRVRDALATNAPNAQELFDATSRSWEIDYNRDNIGPDADGASWNYDEDYRLVLKFENGLMYTRVRGLNLGGIIGGAGAVSDTWRYKEPGDNKWKRLWPGRRKTLIERYGG